MNLNERGYLAPITILSALLIALSVPPARALEGLEVSAGAGGYLMPAYLGSSESVFIPVPVGRVAYNNKGNNYYLSLNDGLGVSRFDASRKLVGSLSLNGGEKRNSRWYESLSGRVAHPASVKELLAGTPDVSSPLRAEAMLGRVTGAGIFGVILGYYPSRVQLAGGERTYDGLLASLMWTAPVPLGERFAVTAVAAADFMNGKYADAWYSLGSATARLPAYDAAAGARSLRFVLQADYAGPRGPGATLLLSDTLLLGDAGDSPYTERRNQLTLGIYTFFNF